MSLLKKHASLVIETVYLSFIFFISQLPIRDFDIWFHIKSGELFLSRGLTFTEVFSHTAYGRQWIPFEWLFQIAVFLLSKIGFWILPPIISIFVVITQWILLRTLRYIFNVGIITRLLLVFAFFVSTYEFNTIRPHVIAYTFFTLTLFLCLAKYFKGKNWIYISPLYTLIWTNIHSSGFLSWGLSLSFALVALAEWRLQNKKEYLSPAKDFFILSVINAIISVLPPTGLLDYKLLWEFFSDRKLLATFIAEWAPATLSENALGVTTYTVTAALSIVCVIFFMLREKQIKNHLWTFPFILIVLMGYSATRNIFLGNIAIVILLGYSISHLTQSVVRKRRIWIFAPLFLSSLGFFIYMYNGKVHEYATMRFYYPVKAARFISANLSGNMFNEYSYGGYLLYYVYPRLKVFIDGRAEVYHCCEMRDYMQLAYNKYLPDEQYRKFLDSFFSKYKISFAVLGTTKHVIMRRISTLLSTDPDWALVFWDDDAQIFVRRDGKNTGVIEKYEAKAATPYLRDPFMKDKTELALSEYERMETVAKSARTSNAIGYLNLLAGDYTKAGNRFEEALKLDPTFESPYMNLAELSAKDGDIEDAINLYSKARSLAPDRGLVYIRLGQLIAQNGDQEKARSIWQEGLKYTVDTDARDQLEKLLGT